MNCTVIENGENETARGSLAFQKLQPQTLVSPTGHAVNNTTVSGHANAHFGDVYQNHYHLPASEISIYDALYNSLAFDRMNARLSNVDRALPGTCQWLFDHESFMDWADWNNIDNHCGFLWIKGKPGSGKSTILKEVLSWAEKEWSTQIVISYFFNARASEQIERSSLGLYRSLLHQLLSKSPAARSLFLSRFSTKAREGKVEHWTETELQNFFIEVVSVTSEVRPRITMLIDALDEGQEDDIRHMLSYLECLAKYAVSASASLRICLSSRHYPRITVKKALSVIVEHEAGHKKDIQEYVMEGLRGIDDRQTFVLQTEVLKRSSGIFLWVVLVVQLLNTMCDRGEPSAVILKEVRSIPKNLHDLFAKLLKSSNEEPEACMTLLRWVMFSGRPLRPIELYLAIRQAHAPQEEWSEAQCVDRTTATTYVLNCSRGLIEVSGSGVGRTRPTAKLQFIHESVRDYLMAADVLTAHDLVREPPTSMSREALCHAAIAEICLQYLSHFCRTASRVDEKDMGKRYPLVDYASHYCWQHLQKSRSAHSQNLLELSWSILTVEDVRKRRIVQARIHGLRSPSQVSVVHRATLDARAMFCSNDGPACIGVPRVEVHDQR